MKKNLVQDERILNQKRKIGSDTCQLLMIFLIGSVLIQQLIFNAPFSSYAVEFFAFFGAAIYIIIRSVLCGHELLEKKASKKKTIIINSLVSGVSIVAVTLFLNISSLSTPDFNRGAFMITLFISFIVGSLASFIAYYIIDWFNQRCIAKLDKEFNNEDDQEDL